MCGSQPVSAGPLRMVAPWGCFHIIGSEAAVGLCVPQGQTAISGVSGICGKRMLNSTLPSRLGAGGCAAASSRVGFGARWC